MDGENNFLYRAYIQRPHYWYVLFCPAIRQGFFHHFTKHRKNFEHVSLLRFDRRVRTWIVIDWNSWGLCAQPVTRLDAQLILQRSLENEYPILGYVSRPAKPKRLKFGFSCVESAKHVLGVDTWAVTPYQLYCALKKEGAEDKMMKDFVGVQYE